MTSRQKTQTKPKQKKVNNDRKNGDGEIRVFFWRYRIKAL